jgi:hypothetical protein
LLVRIKSITQQQTIPTNPNTNTPAVYTRTAVLTVRKVNTSGAPVDLNDQDYEVTLPPELQYIKGPNTNVTPQVASGTLQISYNPATPLAPYAERKGTIFFGQLAKDFTFHL